MKTRREILLHPVRMQILQYLSKSGGTTPGELSELMPEVPRTTLYRHINLLYSEGYLKVSKEVKIRGTYEREYEINPEVMSGKGKKEKERQDTFNTLLKMIGDFEDYYERPDSDSEKDMLFFTGNMLNLSDSEFSSFLQELFELIAKYDVLPEKPEQKTRSITMISAPVTGSDRVAAAGKKNKKEKMAASESGKGGTAASEDKEAEKKVEAPAGGEIGGDADGAGKTAGSEETAITAESAEAAGKAGKTETTGTAKTAEMSETGSNAKTAGKTEPERSVKTAGNAESGRSAETAETAGSEGTAEAVGEAGAIAEPETGKTPAGAAEKSAGAAEIETEWGTGIKAAVLRKPGKAEEKPKPTTPTRMTFRQAMEKLSGSLRITDTVSRGGRFEMSADATYDMAGKVKTQKEEDE